MALRALVKADGKKAVDKTSVAQLYRWWCVTTALHYRYSIAILCAENNLHVKI